MKTLGCALALSLTIIPFAAAQRQAFTMNPDTSSVAFTLKAPGHEVHGTFHVRSGEIEFDLSKPAVSGLIVVTAASGQSGEKGLDDKMHAEVLDVAHYADVTFRPESYQGVIAPSGDSNIQVSGTFTLHGTQHEITVPMQVHIEDTNLVAKGSFMVPYVKWGLKDPSLFILRVAKQVKVDLDLKGTLAK